MLKWILINFIMFAEIHTALKTKHSYHVARYCILVFDVCHVWGTFDINSDEMLLD